MKADALVHELDKLAMIVHRLINADSNEERLRVLENEDACIHYLNENAAINSIYLRSTLKDKLVISAIAVIGEGPVVFRTVESADADMLKFEQLLHRLREIDSFYHEMGGLAGYHFSALKCLREKGGGHQSSSRYLKPHGVDVSMPGKQTDQYVRQAVENLPILGAIFPIGGAGDRLDLRDEATGEPLPAAELLFCGRSLLESLIRELQAMEFLYHKLTGNEIVIPIAMMTSEEKDNDRRIKDICIRNNWFGRFEENFTFFIQPMVPVLTVEGRWSMSGPFEMTLKPGGHGAVWKLARDRGVFNWFLEKKRKKILIRQINNPVAGTDSGLLAFCGVGCGAGRIFGFSSCRRLLKAAEGMLVLAVNENEGHFEYAVSNIEYTDFTKRGLEDLPEFENSIYSKFPANTNILFADIEGISAIVETHPFPQLVMNCKNKAPYIDKKGERAEMPAGRLESMMQNISDSLNDVSDHFPGEEELSSMKAFVTYNERRKTISVTKKAYHSEGALLETPEGCFYEILQNNQELFTRDCRMDIPQLCSEEIYIQNGPNFLLLYHPGLGPLYSVIAQKIQGGRIREQGELQLEIAELALGNVELEGSLIIEADQPLLGKCELINVRVKNEGIDRRAPNVYWKNQIKRKEKLHIILRGYAEFAAENVEFAGDHMIEVPDGYRWTAFQQGADVKFRKEKIFSPTWRWDYAFDENDRIRLRR